jgi:hypothetical protein
MAAQSASFEITIWSGANVGMLLNLSLVTEALVSLIDKYIRASPEAAAIAGLKVSSEPRDKLTGDSTVGLYLYHITEDAHFKNLPAPSADTPPIRFTPMGLSLYYQLSAHSDTPFEPGIQKEHLLIGLAIKALRDYPIIDDTTEIGNPLVKVFPANLRDADNRLRISLMPVMHNEALSYSTAGAQPLRLSTYYQVSVALLEPFEPTLRAGRVLKYGVFTFTRGAPRLDGSRSNVTFTIPGETTPRVVDIRPAEAAVRNLATNTGGEIVFFGSDLAGDETTLLIKNVLFTEPVEVGFDWGVTATDSEVFAVVYPSAGLVTILPGMYSAVARVTTHKMGPDNKLRTFVKTSNETPFIVTPRIDTISAPTAAGVVTVTGAVFQDPALSVEAVETFVGSNKLPLKAPGPLNPGEFEVVNVTTLRFRYPIAGINSNETLPFRLIINGAESAPNWVVTP